MRDKSMIHHGVMADDFGMGLKTCSWMVERHGGLWKLWVDMRAQHTGGKQTVLSRCYHTSLAESAYIHPTPKAEVSATPL